MEPGLDSEGSGRVRLLEVWEQVERTGRVVQHALLVATGKYRAVVELRWPSSNGRVWTSVPLLQQVTAKQCLRVCGRCSCRKSSHLEMGLAIPRELWDQFSYRVAVVH